MKPIYYKKYSKQTENSFLARYAEVAHTYNQFHYHNEYELLYTIENCGTRFVGDSIHRFNNGDLVLVGPNIPHYWHSDDIYFEGHDDLKAKVVLVQFLKKFLGERFFQIPELKLVDEFLGKAEQGIQITGKEAQLIGDKIIQLPSFSGWKKILLMIDILCEMAEAKNYKLLTSPGFCEVSRLGREEKISRIFNYMVHNYQKEISLNEIADFANMNVSAFCRYFKKSINKTFSQAMNEIRIGFACKELINTCKSISEIAFNCGYLNVPYFNRVFRKIKNITPQEYRNQFINNQEQFPHDP